MSAENLKTSSARMKVIPQTADRALKKGDLLFAEGDNSKSMYLIKRGVLRLFKKKGDSSIEIGTIHSGEILGELAFLDGMPRSASAEGLTDCTLVEISSDKFSATLKSLPDWLKLLLKTVVGRLRAASTKIRQLEQASTAIDYNKGSGKNTYYVYISVPDFLKTGAAIMLVGSFHGSGAKFPDGKPMAGKEIRVSLLQRYANQMMGVPVSKITSILDILTAAKIVSLGDEETGSNVVLKDIEFLEQFLNYLTEENLKEPSKRHDLSKKGFLIMSFIQKHMEKFEKDAISGIAHVNLATILQLEKDSRGKDLFRLEETEELRKLGYTTQLNAKSSTEMMTTVNYEEFSKVYRFQKVIKLMEEMNESKQPKGRAA